MSEQLTQFVADERCAIEAALRGSLPVSTLPSAGRLNEALEYAVFPGGKRLRPALALLASDLAGAARAQGMAVACAVEFLHSSSLILDDLPSMDDADLRRSRPALHLVHGEGLAVLASVALLNQSYALLAGASLSCGGGAEAGAALVREAARCVGSDGMVGGQVVDLETRAGSAGPDALACRDLKTVALMRLMMTAGALACGADGEDVRALADFGECFGRAYQICDDLLDGGNHAATGKPARQDERHARASAVSTLGEDAARRFAAELVGRGRARLGERFGPRREARLLGEAAERVLGRAGAGMAGVAV
jgi:geranylgeranyl diphosphate synthase type II